MPKELKLTEADKETCEKAFGSGILKMLSCCKIEKQVSTEASFHLNDLPALAGLIKHRRSVTHVEMRHKSRMELL